MPDRTGTDPLAFWLAFVHPAWMLASLFLGALTLRLGLRLRSERRGGRRRPPELRRLHLRLAKPTLVMLVAGFASGPISIVTLRGAEAFGTAHAWVSSAALALFLATGWMGRRLEKGSIPGEERSRFLDRHAALGTLALLAGAAAFGTGFVLLP